MAGNADGVIRIDAEIDSSGFQKNSQRLESAITSFSQKINTLGRQMEAAIANGATQKQLDSMKLKMAGAEESMQNLQGKFRDLSNTIVSTKQFEDLEKAIGKTQEQLNKLYDKEEKLKALGANASSIKYEKLQQEIQSTYEKIDILSQKAKAATEQVKTVMSTSIKGMTAEEINARSERIAQLSNQAAAAKVELSAAKAELTALLKEDEKMTASGADQGSKQWQSLQYDIEQTKDKLQQYLDKWASYVATNKDVSLAGDSSNMQKMGAILQQAGVKLGEMRTQAETASTALQKAESSGRGVSEAFASLATSAMKVVSSGIHTIFKTLGSVLSNVASKAAKLAKTGFNAVVSGLRSVATNAVKAYANLYKVVSAGIISGFKKLGSAIGSAASSGLKALGSAALNASKSLLSLNKSNNDLSKGLNIGFKNVLRYVFGIRSTFMLIRRLRSAITEGLGEMAKVDTTTNQAISSMITSLNRLKASLSTAFQPIVTAISPYVTRLLQLLTQAMEKTAEFVAILTGQKYYLKANVTETDYAKSLDQTTKSTKKKSDATNKNTKATKKNTKATAAANKEAERQLAAFDHLNILSDNSKNNGGGGAADAANDAADALNNLGDAVSEMGKTTYTKVAVKGISDFLSKIKKAIADGDFDGVGRAIAEKLNSALAKINELVNWDNIGEKATAFIDAITSVFNGLVDGLDWALLGNTIGNAINSIVYAFDTLLEGVDWDNLGKKIAEGLNSLVTTVDWGAVGSLFAKRIGSMLDLVYSAVTTFNWEDAAQKLAEGLNAFIETLTEYFDADDKEFHKIGDALANALNTFMTEFSWENAGNLLGAGVDILTEVLGSFIEGANWAQVGFSLATGINSFIYRVNWDYLGTVLGEGIQGAIDAMKGFVEEFDWGAAGDKFADTVIALRKEVSFSDLGTTLGALLNGALAALGKAARGFTWGNFGKDFADGVNALVKEVSWSKLGETLANWLTIPFTWLKNAARNFKWGEAGQGFADAVNSLVSNVTWSDIGDSFKEMLMGALDMTGKFLQIVQPARLGAGIREALDKVPWGTIANTVWTQAKQAFKNAGSFLDALFGDTGAGMNLSAQQKASLLQNSGYLSDKLVDSRSLGTKIGDKIRKTLATIPWDDIASTMWNTAKDAISNAGDFVKAILGVTQADIIGANGSEGLAIGKKIGEKVAEGIGKIQWGEFGQFLSDSAINLFNTFTGFFMALGEKDGENKSKLQRAIEEFFSKIDWVELVKSLVEAAVEAFYTLGEALFDAILDGLTHNADEQVKQNVNEKFEAMDEAVQANKEDARTVLNAARQYIFSLSGDKNEETFGDSIAMQFYKGLRKGLLDGNGEVKSEYEDILTSILNDQGISMEAFKAGEFDVEQFYSGYLTSAYEEETPTTEKWVELVSRMTGAGSETAESNGANIADSAATGYVNQTQAVQEMLRNATSESFESVWNEIDAEGEGESVAYEYYIALMEEIADNGRVKDEYRAAVAEIFGSEDALDYGIKDGKGFLQGIVTGATNEKTATTAGLIDVVDGILTDVKESPEGMDMHSPSKRTEAWGEGAMQGMVQGAENEESSATKKTTSVFSNVLTSVNSTFAGALLMIQKNIPGFTDAVNTLFQSSTNKWNDTFKTGMTNIVNTTATSMTTLQSTILTALTNLQNHFPTRFNTYNSQFTTGFNSIKNTTLNAFNQITSAVQNAMNNIQSNFSNGMSAIVSLAYSQMNDISNAIYNGLNNARNQANSIDWYGVGINIVRGIYNGINGWWGWLNNTVWNMAISLYNTARNALGIHSPSTLFRDGVGKMIGLGIGEGVEDSEPSILDSVSEITNAIMDEMNDTNAMANLSVHTDNLLNGLDTVLTTFSDRVGTSFTDLITKLDAIAASVAFRTPAVATGGVLPYSVSANPVNGLNSQSGAQNGIDELASVIIQSTNQAALAIVRAIEKYGDSKPGVTRRELVDIVVTEHNRMARAMGESPLLI